MLCKYLSCPIVWLGCVDLCQVILAVIIVLTLLNSDSDIYTFITTKASVHFKMLPWNLMFSFSGRDFLKATALPIHFEFSAISLYT